MENENRYRRTGVCHRSRIELLGEVGKRLMDYQWQVNIRPQTTLNGIWRSLNFIFLGRKFCSNCWPVQRRIGCGLRKCTTFLVDTALGKLCLCSDCGVPSHCSWWKGKGTIWHRPSGGDQPRRLEGRKDRGLPVFLWTLAGGLQV